MTTGAVAVTAGAVALTAGAVAVAARFVTVSGRSVVMAGVIVVPALESNTDLAIPLAFDALRYVAWMLGIARDADAVVLYRSEQQVLSEYQKYMQSVDALLKKGVVGAGLSDL